MYDCQYLDHPFLHDPGVAQADRALKALLPENISIDGRTTADLLNYFTQLAPQINFYDDTDGSISDWTLFFRDNLAFLLSQMAAYPVDVKQQKLAGYAHLLEKNATTPGLQLLLFYSYYTLIQPVHRWAMRLQGTNVDLETSLNKLIKENLQQPLLSFISLANTASHCYGTRRIDFSDLLNLPAWGLEPADIYANRPNFVCNAGGMRAQLLSLWGMVNDTLPFFTGVIGQTSAGAADDVNDKLQQLLTLSGKKDMSPHLALLFSFITIFKKFQTDGLNAFAKRHLDFFYTRVLQLKPAPAVADNAFLVVTIQQQARQYLLEQGVLVKAGKDNNKADILFGLDEPFVANLATITDVKTLFFNNLAHYDEWYTEGVYMAPNALMADGMIKPFTDPSTASFATLGSPASKYIPTGAESPIPYPSARLGFILHSPVLLLSEGARKVTITLACDYVGNICPDDLPGGLTLDELLIQVNSTLGRVFHYFSQDNVAAALTKGLDAKLGKKLVDSFLTQDVADCYGTHPVSLYDHQADDADLALALTTAEIASLAPFFPAQTLFQVQFSGAKGWVAPLTVPTILLTRIGVGTEFGLVFTIDLDPTLPAITPYDKKVLGGVDYPTTDPLVMITLDDSLKLIYTSPNKDPDCCLEPVAPSDILEVSAYHFFKHFRIKEAVTGFETSITTDVCGMKNVIVQNDQSLMDVNAPIYPFGTRPSIVDFSLVQPTPPLPMGAIPNLVGPNFYIGSAEIFCKAWTKVWVGVNWKDLPLSFNDYYVGYFYTTTKHGLDKSAFWVNLAVLRDGVWTKENNTGFSTNTLVIPSGITDNDRPLFDVEPDGSPCAINGDYAYSFYVLPNDFGITTKFTPFPVLTKYNADTRNGFLRFTLENQDFLHKDYPFVLARQMLAFGKLPDNTIDSAVYYDSSIPGYFVLDSEGVAQQLQDLIDLANDVEQEAKDVRDSAATGVPGDIPDPPAQSIRDAMEDDTDPLNPTGLYPDTQTLSTQLQLTSTSMPGSHVKKEAVIPKEPWTPIIQNMVVNYSATATSADMGLIHLYPFDGTFEKMDIEAGVGLLPLFCAEGLLFLGLQGLAPGENLNILFQLAEATADTEDAPDAVNWEYLVNNQWKPLAPNSQVLKDGTQALTRSGIVELAIPKDIGSDNTVMPKDKYWLRASVPSHVAGVSETIALYTQAVEATFTIQPGDPATATAASDLGRLATPLKAGSLTKLNVADANVTKIDQPSPSFGGKAPESSGNAFFMRISELLRHKGRGIQKWDYERLVLANFPQVLRAKCINHSYFLNAHQYLYDFPMAPGNVLVAVIPDISQLPASDSLQPRVPQSMLEDIRDWLRGIISPFIQLFVANPRYEPVDFCLQLVLVKGSDTSFYQEQVKKDLRKYLAPWLTGDMDRFAFGQPLYRSDVIRFLEGLAYVDYLLDLVMVHQGEALPPDIPESLEPLTPRSILVAGEIVVNIPDPIPDPGKPPVADCANAPVPVVNHCPTIIVNANPIN